MPAAGTQFRVDGDDQLARTLKDAAKDLANTEDRNRDAAEIVADAARGSAPVLTGELAGSIDTEATDAYGQAIAEAPYAPFVEFGVPSRGQSAQPFMTTALADNEDRIVDLYDDLAHDVIGNVKGA